MSIGVASIEEYPNIFNIDELISASIKSYTTQNTKEKIGQNNKIKEKIKHGFIQSEAMFYFLLILPIIF